MAKSSFKTTIVDNAEKYCDEPAASRFLDEAVKTKTDATKDIC